MINQPKLYIAGIGMITPVGANTAMTAAAVKAGISGYHESRYHNSEGNPITMTRIPEDVFSNCEIEIDENGHYSEQSDHIIKMAIMAINEAIHSLQTNKPIPLVLCMPEEGETNYSINHELLINNLLNQKSLPLEKSLIRMMPTGRAAGIQALDWAAHFLYQQNHSYVLIGGSDSYCNISRLLKLDEEKRLLAEQRMDGFAAGEGAGFLLLTKHPENTIKSNKCVAIFLPGNSQEPGHIKSSQPYRGEGLDKAFKMAIACSNVTNIKSIYSSMNGEHHWAKEYGVAAIRNKQYMNEDVTIEHPADCYGDLGAATTPILMGLAANHLMTQPKDSVYLVYGSADGPWRSAVTMQKIN